MRRARRPAWRRFRAALAACLWLALPAAAASPESVTTHLGPAYARFDLPTDRYGHAIMGDLPEWGRLCLTVAGQDACVTLPETSVFEDIAPRLHDVDGDAVPDVVVVESAVTAGAALAVYRLRGNGLERIATPHIGTRNRWLAPAAIADLDGDGHVELAYIDRPHLARRLRIWRYENGALRHVADAPGLTNHRIGEPFISGGLRRCGADLALITANADWSRVMASRLVGDRIVTRDVGPYSPSALERALACD